MPASVGPAALAERFQFLGGGLVVDAVVYDNDSRRAMPARVGGLAVVLGVIGVNLAVEYALLVELLRLMREHEDELALYVDPRVVVIVVFGRRDSVSGKDYSGGSFSVRRKAERHEILVELQRLLLARDAKNRADSLCPASRWW